MTRRFMGPSASRPMIGVATAPVIKAAVSNHSAVLSETPSARAMLGISGAPRLLTMATSTATQTSVGMVARLRHDASGPARRRDGGSSRGCRRNLRHRLGSYHHPMTSLGDIFRPLTVGLPGGRAGLTASPG